MQVMKVSKNLPIYQAVSKSCPKVDMMSLRGRGERKRCERKW